MQITINGSTIDGLEGQTVLEVARENGIYIPALCYHPKTGPAAKCRACVVEVAGLKGLQTSCTFEIKEGLEVTTNSERVLEAQKLVVDLLLSSGRHDCVSCEKNGDCELQDAAYYLGIEHPAFDLPEEDRGIDDSSEFIHIDHSKCISCGRCIAGCNNTVTNEVLAFGFRAHQTKVICDDDLPMGLSSCVQCGECVQLCPVGAIIDKPSIGKGRSWDLRKVNTVCSYCGVGCQITFNVNKKTNEIVRITGVEGAPTNDGMLCVKGRYGYDFITSEERLTTPLIRNNEGQLIEATWEDALACIAEKFNGIKKEYGPDAIGGLSSAKVTNEENYAFQKFMRREIGTNNVDHCARL